jgi:hypothetical protein
MKKRRKERKVKSNYWQNAKWHESLTLNACNKRINRKVVTDSIHSNVFFWTSISKYIYTERFSQNLVLRGYIKIAEANLVAKP